MSTRSHIAIARDNGTYDYIYCHSDGYPSHNGAILEECYNTKEFVNELISLGDMSLLDKRLHPRNPTDKSHPHSFEQREKGVCIFYGRDRGERNCEAESADSLHEFVRDFPYTYVFTDGAWECYNRDGLLEKITEE